MTLLNKISVSAAALAVSAGMAAASPVTLVTPIAQPTVPDAWSQVDLSSPLGAGGDGVGVAGGTWDPSMAPFIFEDSVAGLRRSPWEHAEDWNVTPASNRRYLQEDGNFATGSGLSFYSVGPNPNKNSPATLLFSIMQQSFGLLWGSPDSYNEICFSGGYHGTQCFTGNQLVPPATPGGQGGAAFVRFEGLFNQVQFFSDAPAGVERAAFEFAGITAAPIPLPAPVLMMLAGLGALGGLGWSRRNRDKATV